MILGELDITQIGIACVCLLYVIKMMWDGVMKLKSPKSLDIGVAFKELSGKLENLINSINDQNSNDKVFRRDFYEMKTQTKELHDWHNVNDEDGRKLWYFKGSLEKAIIANTEMVKENNSNLLNLEKTIKDLDS